MLPPVVIEPLNPDNRSGLKSYLTSNPTGFDYWEVLPGQGSYYNPDLMQMDNSKKRCEGFCTDIITDLSLQWLERAFCHAARKYG